ncbi:MAG: hypothetical protein HDT44_05560 [Ruminococcaceae bacterium]|nr:hypothetical protein [Oscillospiraceae bacterium]
MRIVYNLNMIDKESSYDDHVEAFNIGFFSSRDKAEKIAKRYLTEVNGFKDYNVTYQITDKGVIDSTDSLILSDLFVIYGWDKNDELDEINVIESNCYVLKQEAEQKLNELRSSYLREEWCIDKYIIDECNWQNGFVKVYH